MVPISLQNSGGKVVFLGGQGTPPLMCTNVTRVKVPWSLKGSPLEVLLAHRP